MTDRTTNIRCGALISPDGVFRYTLTREWDKDRPALVVIGLNPSTADAKNDDPTIRRCVRFARDSDHGGLVMLNLFAFRATDPKDLVTTGYKTGDPRNQEEIHRLAGSGTLLAAWGAIKNRHVRRRQWRVTARLSGPIYCLGKCKNGDPRHPLYVKANQRFEVWREFRDVKGPRIIA